MFVYGSCEGTQNGRATWCAERMEALPPHRHAEPVAGTGQQLPAVTGGIQPEVACAPAAAAAVQQARRSVAARTGGLEDGFLDGPAAQAVTLPG